jgi:hypothetical protein
MLMKKTIHAGDNSLGESPKGGESIGGPDFRISIRKLRLAVPS